MLSKIVNNQKTQDYTLNKKIIENGEVNKRIFIETSDNSENNKKNSEDDVSLNQSKQFFNNISFKL